MPNCIYALYIATWTHIIGLLQNSTRGLGQVSVSGLSLVPKPPTRIIAFRCADVVFVMVIKLIETGGTRVKAAKHREEANTDVEKPRKCKTTPGLSCVRTTRCLIGSHGIPRCQVRSPTEMTHSPERVSAANATQALTLQSLVGKNLIAPLHADGCAVLTLMLLILVDVCADSLIPHGDGSRTAHLARDSRLETEPARSCHVAGCTRLVQYASVVMC